MPWPTSNHESPDVDLAIPQVVAPHYLWSILKADGASFRSNNYEAFRRNIAAATTLFGQGFGAAQKPSADVSEQRLRTWKKAFEDMGILTVEDDIVRATRFGRAIVGGWDRVDTELQGANERIALLGAEVANRILLAVPGKADSRIPADADLFPIRAIWRAFRQLDDRLHWQDINRVLGQVHYESDVEQAIQKIRTFRVRHNNNYATETLDELGSSELSSDVRHVTPWFNRASIGGLLFPSEADDRGFRQLSDSGRIVIDEMIADAPPLLAKGADYETYLKYLMEPVEILDTEISAEDTPVVDDVCNIAKQFGRSKFIALAGLPGTGKTRLARLVAEQLVEGDQSRLREIQFHESISYEDFIEGFVPKKDGSGFELRSKTLRSINDRALTDPTQLYVLLIEEFTRANAHAVLGELLTYIEHRDRTFQWSISQDPGRIAGNLIVITTMNPRDKSAIQLDAAVKRRLHVIEVPPSVAGLESILKNLDEPAIEKLLLWYQKFWNILPFGHGLFAQVKDEKSLRLIWNGTVRTLLTDVSGETAFIYREAYDEFPYR